VHKGSTQTNKRSKLGFKSKGAKEPKSALVWRTGLSYGTPHSVQCTRTIHLRTLHLRVSQAALRYNSLNCPVCHRTVRCTKRSNGYQRNGQLQQTPVNTTMCGQCAQKSEQTPEAHRTVNSACPVRHRTVRCHKKTKVQRSSAPKP
jgi:hypothetical protein